MIFRITPTKEEKRFLKEHKDFLKQMLSRWIWEMKIDILNMPSETLAEREERDRAISTMKFIESILKTINLVVEEPKQPQSYI